MPIIKFNKNIVIDKVTILLSDLWKKNEIVLTPCENNLYKYEDSLLRVEICIGDNCYKLTIEIMDIKSSTTAYRKVPYEDLFYKMLTVHSDKLRFINGINDCAYHYPIYQLLEASLTYPVYPVREFTKSWKGFILTYVPNPLSYIGILSLRNTELLFEETVSDFRIAVRKKLRDMECGNSDLLILSTHTKSARK
jgi:hypothetical protein